MEVQLLWYMISKKRSNVALPKKQQRASSPLSFQSQSRSWKKRMGCPWLSFLGCLSHWHCRKAGNYDSRHTAHLRCTCFMSVFLPSIYSSSKPSNQPSTCPRTTNWPKQRILALIICCWALLMNQHHHRVTTTTTTATTESSPPARGPAHRCGHATRRRTFQGHTAASAERFLPWSKRWTVPGHRMELGSARNRFSLDGL